MGFRIDLSGKKFGEWTVLDFDEANSTSKCKKWSCRCSCGNVVSVGAGNLVNGTSTRCLTCSGNAEHNLTGKTFGSWTVLEKGKKLRTWACKCGCGKICEVLNYHLLSGASTKCRDCVGSSPKELEIGSQFGDLTVIGNLNIKGNIYSECQCKCGRITKVRPTFLKKENGIRSCRNCSSWKGYGEISSCWWSMQKRQADERGLEFSITIEYIWDMYLKQNRKCNLSGLPIHFYRNPSKNYNLQTASLDRIDNNKGYTTDNVQLVYKRVNFMKHTNEQRAFILYCKLIADKSYEEQPEIGDYFI